MSPFFELIVTILVIIMIVMLCIATSIILYDSQKIENYESNNAAKYSWVSLSNMGLATPSETWMNDDIPMIIHQMAPSDEGKWHGIWKGCHATWKEKYPVDIWTHIMWTDESLDDFVYKQYPEFYNQVYSKYPRNIQRFDISRYIILYHYGGMYADMDYECVHPFWHLLEAGRANVAESAHVGEGFQNALMASPKAHPFWHYVLYEVLLASGEPDVLQSTGPQTIVRAKSLAPASMFHPLPADAFSVNGSGKTAWEKGTSEFVPSDKDDVYAVHWGSGAWSDK